MTTKQIVVTREDCFYQTDFSLIDVNIIDTFYPFPASITIENSMNYCRIIKLPNIRQL